jgi:HlyD family secretion protein
VVTPSRQLPALPGLLAALLLACGGGEGADVGATARAERGRIERIVVATGTVEPEREVEVRARIPGIVEKIHVEAGDEVEKDEPLLEIERDLLESAVREAEAALEDMRVEQRFAKIALDRMGELEKGGAASQQTRDDALTRYQRASAGVARARAARDNLATQLSYATVRAPIAGRVLDVYVEEGTAVAPVTAVTGGVVLVSLAGAKTLFLKGLVDENEIARVRLGQPARVRTEAYPERAFEGVVAEIAPLGQRVQNVTYFELEIEIVDADASLLRPRMSGDADIVAEVVEGALFVPESALRYRGEQIYVEVVARASEARVEERDIEIGIVDGSRVQVLSGLAEGDEVRLQ